MTHAPNDILRIATAYGLDNKGIVVRVSVVLRIVFSPRRSPRNPMATDHVYNIIKRPGHEADHLLSISAQVKNAYTYTSSPPYVIMA
jgi:hypothetical protein